jgi:hypothetical protein
MQNMGLLPLADDWMHSYETTVRHLNPKKMSLSVSSNNSTPYELIYGNDYWETIIGPEFIDLPLVKSPSDENCVLLTDMFDGDIPKMRDSHVKMVLTNNRSESKRSLPKPSSDKTILHLSNESYEELVTMKDARITYSGVLEEDRITAKNVGGVIIGEDRTRVLLFGAHYDHLGAIQGTSSRLVWRGALDNASGVAGMLAVAQEINTLLSGKAPACDIAFAAFNCEESDLSGSRYFAQYLEKKYSQVILVNMDCIGKNEVDALHIFVNETDSSKALATYFSHGWTNKKIPLQIQKGSLLSDHTSFSSSVCLSSLSDEEKSSEQIHVLEDTIDKVDMSLIASQMNAVASHLLNAVDDPDFWAMCPGKELTTSDSVIESGPEIHGLTLSDFEKQFGIHTYLEKSSNPVVYLNTRTTNQGDDESANLSVDETDLETIRSLRDISTLTFQMEGNPGFFTFIAYNKALPMDMQVRTWEYESNEGASALIATITQEEVWEFYQRPEGGPLAVLEKENDQFYIKCFVAGGSKDVISSEEDCKKWLASFPIQFLENMTSHFLMPDSDVRYIGR